MELKSRIKMQRITNAAILIAGGAVILGILWTILHAPFKTNWTTGNTGGFIAYFPLQFLTLLTFYFVAFMLIMSAAKTAYGITNPPRITFSEALSKECGHFVKNNNRRWLYLLVALAITHCMVVENPGPGPIIEGISHIPSAVFSQSTRDSADAHTNYLLYGDPNPKAPSLWPKDNVSASIKTTEAEASARTAWDRFAGARFWREARFYLLILTVAYFFVAFSDEVAIGVRGFIREAAAFVQKKKDEKNASADPKASATVSPSTSSKQASTATASTQAGTVTATVPPGSAPSATATVTVASPQPVKEKTEFGIIFLASLLAEVLPKIFHEIFDHMEEKKRKREAFV